MKKRLSLLYFLQFSVWGCYLSSFGQFLGAGGLGADIAWFYAAIGLVSILTPPLLGRLADRTGRPERLLGLCHLAGALVMFAMWRYGMTHPHLDFKVLYPLYLLFLSMYMPTMALANTSTFGLLEQSGRTPAEDFPKIRIWGTVGFVAAAWFVNSAYWHDGTLCFTLNDRGNAGPLRFQYNAMQLLCSGVMGLVTAAYTLTLPGLKERRAGNQNRAASTRECLKALLGRHEVAIFLLFVIFSGVCLQISNGFATPYITHFSGIPEFKDSLAAGNATMLFSLSQISEAFCVLFVGIALRRKGIRWVYAIGLGAWSLRFLLLGAGNPSSGLWLLIGSMIIYGIAFNFITIGGHIHIQQLAPDGMKGFAQGLMMFMSNGIGATFGTIAAGAIVNRWCSWQMVSSAATPMRLFMGDWLYPWMIFAGCAALVMVAWLLFSPRKESGPRALR